MRARVCVCVGGECTDVAISKRTRLVVQENAVPCWYLHQEQGCGSAGMRKLKTARAKTKGGRLRRPTHQKVRHVEVKYSNNSC